MQKPLLIIGMFLFSITLCFSQTTLLDFEADGLTANFTAFGADAFEGPQFEVIANPDASGLNVSDSVGHYIEPNIGEPWQGMFFDPATPVELTSGNTKLCAKVWMQEAGTFTFKVEGDGLNVEGTAVPVDVTQQWTEVCYDFAGSDAVDKTATRIVFFFNIGSVPAETTSHYFDDVVQAATITGTNNIESSAFRLYPNPVEDVLRFETELDVKEVVIFDLLGKELSRSFATAQGEVSTTNLQSGVYVISFTDKNGVLGAKRFVKL